MSKLTVKVIESRQKKKHNRNNNFNLPSTNLVSYKALKLSYGLRVSGFDLNRTNDRAEKMRFSIYEI